STSTTGGTVPQPTHSASTITDARFIAPRYPRSRAHETGVAASCNVLSGWKASGALHDDDRPRVGRARRSPAERVVAGSETAVPQSTAPAAAHAFWPRPREGR